MKFKIISGGQTGADLAGLWIAKIFAIPTGGHAPKHFFTQNGSQPNLETLFGLVEHSHGYRERTIENVKNSDVTLVFSKHLKSPGTVLTINSCVRHNKPYFVIPDNRDRELDTVKSYWNYHNNPGMERALNFINKKVLFDEDLTINVAGNSTKNSDDIFEFTFFGMWIIIGSLFANDNVIFDRIKFVNSSPSLLSQTLKDKYVAC